MILVSLNKFTVLYSYTTDKISYCFAIILNWVIFNYAPFLLDAVWMIMKTKILTWQGSNLAGNLILLFFYESNEVPLIFLTSGHVGFFCFFPFFFFVIDMLMIPEIYRPWNYNSC